MSEKSLGSYIYEKLDEKLEYSRLELQATIVEDLELSIIEKIGLRDGDTVLDLGSGTGRTSSLIANHFPNCKVIGIEPNPELREKANELISKQGINPKRCSFIDGRSDNIPLLNDSINFSYARALFQHISNPIQSLIEMQRVTCKNGIVSVMDIDDGTIVLHPEVDGWREIGDLVAGVQSKRGGDRYVGRKLKKYMLYAGMHDVKYEIISVTLDMLRSKNFYKILFGFKRQLLQEGERYNAQAKKVFEEIKYSLQEEGAFASTNVFWVCGKT